LRQRFAERSRKSKEPAGRRRYEKRSRRWSAGTIVGWRELQGLLGRLAKLRQHLIRDGSGQRLGKPLSLGFIFYERKERT
jgi:hypothetical protein